MRYVLTLACMVLGVSSVVWAAPRLAVSELVHDFGEVKEGFLVVHRFLLRNEGDSVLTFTRQPGVSCGCTSAPLPKMTLDPDETIELEVRFETTGYGGYRTIRHVYVYSDDPEGSQLTLALQGYVSPHASHEDTAYMLRFRYRVILDVREREAFLRGHLLGAVNVPAGELAQALAWLPSTTLYVCDEAGELGFPAVEALRRQGFWAARVLAGGLAGWVQEFGAYLVVGETPQAEPLIAPGGVSPAQLAQDYVVILDLRSVEAYAQEHLVGAIPVGATGLDTVLEFLLPAAAFPPEHQPFIYCVDEGEGRAQEAAQFLQALGLQRAYALVGGLPQWRIRYGSSFMVSAPLN